MGSCDSASGICNCRAGFSGIACQRFDCVRDDGTGGKDLNINSDSTALRF